MKKVCKNHNPRVIDKCMRNIIEFLDKETCFEVIMCCCGHGIYNPSLIVIDTRVAEFCNRPYELFSGIQFKHGQKKFYKKDKYGYYYIPEVVNENNR